MATQSHVAVPDADSDGFLCEICPLPVAHPSHLRPVESAQARPTPAPGDAALPLDGLTQTPQIPTPARPQPLARTTDPLPARIGAKVPGLNTAKGRVLALLRDNQGRWVPKDDLRSVGGDNGDRRLRELRAEGWPIQMRRDPEHPDGTWQYMLTGEPSTGGVGVVA